MSKLFAPTALGAIQLANRIVMAPLTRSRSTPEGLVQRHGVDYYTQRASAGLIITEGTQPSAMGQGYCRTPGCHTEAQVAAWKAVTSSVHAAGGKIVLQMMHAGRISHPLNQHGVSISVGPSAIRAAGEMYTDQRGPLPHTAPHALSEAEVPSVVAQFAHSAACAIEAGFDGVEVHAANGTHPHPPAPAPPRERAPPEAARLPTPPPLPSSPRGVCAGYLLDQFLCTSTNVRTDRYGGSLKGRIRLPVEVVEAVCDTIGAERTGLRLSPGHLFNDISDEQPMRTAAALLDALPTERMAYVHLMLPDALSPQLSAIEDVGTIVPSLRPHVRGSLLLAGGLDRERAEGLLRADLVQAAVFGRPFIANPDLVRRLREGLPLAEADPALFYSPGAAGYSDYRPYTEP